MKTFEIHCFIYDKLDPLDDTESVSEINLITMVQSEDAYSAEQKLNQLFSVKEILSIQEII